MMPIGFAGGEREKKTVPSLSPSLSTSSVFHNKQGRNKELYRMALTAAIQDAFIE
jgi:hypothetical protein